MKSNVRHTFRPALEALEDRLVPSFSLGSGGDAVAVLTSFQDIHFTALAGWDIKEGNKVPTAAQPAAASHDIHFTTPTGPATVVTAATDAFLKFNGPALPTESVTLNFTKVEM